MGVASMVIGIVALIIGFIPLCGTWALLPAVVGIGLAIADLVAQNKKKGPKGMAIAGLVLNPLAIIVILGWYLFFVGVQSSVQHTWQQQLQQFTPAQNVPTVPLNPAPAQPGQLPQPSQPGPQGIPTVPLQPPQTPPGQSGQPVPPNQPMQPMEPVQPQKPPTR